MSGWIDWTGGECPVPPETMIDVRYRDGTHDYGYAAGSFSAKSWQHHHLSIPITHYRAVPR